MSVTIDLTSKPGPYIRITKRNGFFLSTGADEFTLPYFKPPEFSSKQELRQPIKELFSELWDTLTSVADGAGGGIIGAGVGAAQTLSNIFGLQIGSRLFYAQSWKGSMPTAFTLKFQFFRGISDQWNAFQEVYRPIIALMGDTVPGGDNLALTPPVPSSVNVFVDFSTTFIKALVTDAVNAAASVTGRAGVVLSVTSKSKSDITENNTWKMEFGYGGGKIKFTPFFIINQAIVESSSFQFSPMVERSGNDLFPISGTVTLSCKTQNIMTSADLYTASGTQIT